MLHCVETGQMRKTESGEIDIQAGRHWWKPRPSGRTQSASSLLKMGGLVLWIVGDGEYVVVAGVAFLAINDADDFVDKLEGPAPSSPWNGTQ